MDDINYQTYISKVKSPFIRKCPVRLRLDFASTYETTLKTCDPCDKPQNSLRVPTECEKVILERNNFITAVCRIFPMFTSLTSVDKCKLI